VHDVSYVLAVLRHLRDHGWRLGQGLLQQGWRHQRTNGFDADIVYTGFIVRRQAGLLIVAHV
jgi:hypothetical protein